MGKLLFLISIFWSLVGYGQNKDSLQINAIKNEIFNNGQAYENLRYLCKKIGPRLTASPNAERAVLATKKMLENAGADNVYLQPCLVPHWERGSKETGIINLKNSTKKKIKTTALGHSVGTAPNGLTAEVVEVKSMEDLAALGNKVKGKIVFFNIKMNPENINTFISYSKDGMGRRKGPVEAAKLGAVGVLVRSLAINEDDHPHTGVTRYNDSFPKIPAVAISTNDAVWLSKKLKEGSVKSAYLKVDSKMFADKKLSHNVLGEIIGTEFPNEIITVGGHLDSWDLAEGAHDDGTGCVQAIEIIRAFKALGIKPRRTIRAVMFMDEESGGSGADAYLDSAISKKEKHFFALESDAGGFTPRGFSFECSDTVLNKIKTWEPLLKDLGINEFVQGFSGSDVGDLKKIGAITAGFLPDSQRYFDVHHAESDVFEAVSKRELELGTIAMAALLWLVDQKGL